MTHPYIYPKRRRPRKHDPYGYKRWGSYKPWLRDEFKFRCVYCFTREKWSEDGHRGFGADHLIPKSEDEEKKANYNNLVYACNRCNSLRGTAPLLNPESSPYGIHLEILKDGTILGLTEKGEDIIALLELDADDRVDFRRRLIRVIKIAKRFPDDPEVQAMYRDFMGFPLDLPDLSKLQPSGNRKPEGVEESYFEKKRQGVLPSVY